MIKRLFLGAILLGFVTSLVIAYKAYTFINTTPSAIHEEKIADIQRGMPVKKIAEILEKEGVITSAFSFQIMIRILDKAQDIKAAEYQLFTDMKPQEVLNVLISGRPYLRRVLVPEGSNMEQIAQAFENSLITSKDEFLQAAHDTQLLQSFNIPANSAEGYLFPDSYDFPRRTPGVEVVKKMLQNFSAHYDPAWDEQGKKFNLSHHQIVTLASIIEKETGVDSERLMISAVFHNRLKQKMKLQSDPTVIYGIINFDGNLTKENLRAPTPYNTYINYGLPPGPIARPGKDSLFAAINPANVPFLFFVSKNDGTHIFSTTYKEHRKQVKKFQMGNNPKSPKGSQ